MSLRFAVLGLLDDQPSSGYDLLQRFKWTLANVWPATQSQVYTELAKLAEAALITVSDEGPRGRKEYTITAAGRTELQRWLTEIEPKTLVRNEMLIRVFFLGVVSRADAEEYLARVRARTVEDRADLLQLRDNVDWNTKDDDLSTYGRIALEWGLRYNAMNQEWAEWAITQLPER
ncbi:PadR family transcriptional regulator [Nocardia callitridis]|uniref:Helix-turn-helix transcriptional regulator n=1 Tax=Nocardia callitridis TaxID=648753 RepID=A0ABP9KJD7_9NOCA